MPSTAVARMQLGVCTPHSTRFLMPTRLARTARDRIVSDQWGGQRSLPCVRVVGHICQMTRFLHWVIQREHTQITVNWSPECLYTLWLLRRIPWTYYMQDLRLKQQRWNLVRRVLDLVPNGVSYPDKHHPTQSWRRCTVGHASLPARDASLIRNNTPGHLYCLGRPMPTCDLRQCDRLLL